MIDKPCKCGHLSSEHVNDGDSYICMAKFNDGPAHPDDPHFADNCLNFELDNLRYLEIADAATTRRA